MFHQLKEKFPHLQSKLEKYAGLYKYEEVPTKTILLKEGEVSRKFYYVLKGCLRTWLNDHGRELTFQFFFERQMLAAAYSFRESKPSDFAIETIEPCSLISLHKRDFDTIMDDLGQDPAFLNAAIGTLFELQQHYTEEFLSFIRDTPQQRYLNLVTNKPHILQRIPQHYIASYLGITPVHLSRIRNNILRANKK